MNMDAGQREALEARIKLRRTDPKKAFDETIAELFRTKERLESISTRLNKEPIKVTSKDRMITVTLGERGEVTSIAFNNAKFRRMAPAELGAALVEVLSRADAEGRNRAISAYGPFLPEGIDLEKILSGKLDIGSMLTTAKERGEQILAEAQRPTPTAQQPTRKG